MEAARALVEHKLPLELLYWVLVDRNLPNLPSWVPGLGYGVFSFMPRHEVTQAAGGSKAESR